MDRRSFIYAAAAGMTSRCFAGFHPARQERRRPNFVILYADDMGYADVGTYGAQGFSTPNLDKMASGGRIFTDFYVSQPVCSASRASLLTGCYANRIGIHGALDHMARHGIGNGEMTFAQLVKQREYATQMCGKWHLGHHPQFLPTRHGFDAYFGLPYSNDMWPEHPTNKNYYPPLPLIEDDKVIAVNPDQSQLTTWYTERAVRFIQSNKEKPFLLYVAYTMPHVPLFVSDRYKGRSARGLYGDVIMEIDWSVGRILDALKQNGLEENTFVLFASDNGPWLSYGNHAGSAGRLREGKGTTWEGGIRVPCIMRWPGKIPAGSRCREPLMTIDILPTIAFLSGAGLPSHTIDGRNIWPLIAGSRAAGNPHEALYFYYAGNELQALRSGKWKLLFPHSYNSLTGAPGQGGRPAGYTQARCGLELYNLEEDPGETRDVIARHAEVVRRLQALAEKAREDLGDTLTKRDGRNLREPGRVS
jgi:arylsulfatase A-like enzyme